MTHDAERDRGSSGGPGRPALDDTVGVADEGEDRRSSASAAGDPIGTTVQARMQTLERGATQTLQHNPRSTIEPDRPEGVDTGGRRAVEALAELGTRSLGDGGSLAIEHTLGEGGMGVVHLAEQAALGRKVAVKTLRVEHRDEASKVKLLREAWVTGGLEHPNVVPVYDVGLDDEGLPVIVLKRIEGTHWGQLMGDADAVRDRFGATDLLEWNLQILIQVCNAIHFAHSRGIVHRDLKPENVMVGEFGEVYVLDWGIAVSLHDDGSGRLPLASDAKEMAGTPCYMAPEMLGGEQPALSPRTDVYLLGATLYELLAGKPPHEGETAMQIVRSVIVSEIGLPEDTPGELARICRRAMDPDPDARFENAEQLRLALQGFLRHRGSARLADEASRRLAELEREVAEAPPGDPAAAEERELELYNLFGECRFGFQQALRDWQDNEPARDGLRRATETMIRHELEHGDPRAASRLLGEMDEAPAELAAEVERVRREHDTRRRELEELGRAYDPSVGRRTRTFVTGVLGVLWTVTPLVGPLVFGHGLTVETFTIASVVYLAVAIALGVWARESMTKTLINLHIFKTVITFLLLQLTLLGAAHVMGLEIVVARTMSIFLWAVVTAMVAVFLDPRFVVVSLTYLAVMFAGIRWPEQHHLLIAGGNGVMTLFVVHFMWNLRRYGSSDQPLGGIHGRTVSRSRSAR